MLYTIKNDFLTVSIENRGAELKGIIGADGTSYLWNGDPAYWKGTSPVLFPFVARLYDKKYIIDGKEYSLGIHGFVRDFVLEVTKTSESEIIFTLESNEETLKQYPRLFRFSVHYSLQKNNIVVEYIVENKDEKELVFGFGGHPGFNVPIVPELKFEDYYLKFDNDNAERIIFTDELFYSGNKKEYKLNDNRINLTHSAFDDEAIVLENSGNKVSIMSDKDSHSVTLDYSNFKYVGFWQAIHTDAPYVCIEPWATLPGTQDEIKNFDTAEDLYRLGPGKTFKTDYKVTIK